MRCQGKPIKMKKTEQRSVQAVAKSDCLETCHKLGEVLLQNKFYARRTRKSRGIAKNMAHVQNLF